MVIHTNNRTVRYPNLKINNTDIEHVFEFKLTQSQYVCKVHRILKCPDMFSIALQITGVRFNNKTETTRKSEIRKYEIRNPVFYLPAVKHEFAENSLQHCLTKLINEEHTFSMMSDKVERTSFHSFKVFIKHRVFVKNVHAKLSNVKPAP